MTAAGTGSPCRPQLSSCPAGALVAPLVPRVSCAGTRGVAGCRSSSRQHAAGVDVALVPGERFGEQVRGVAAVGVAQGALVVVAQQGAEVRVGAVLDQDFGAPARGEAAQIGQALFGDDDVDVVLGVV